ncbi:MAG: hypothetical protein AAF740_13465, partial [Bacteroidota bacterium]
FFCCASGEADKVRIFKDSERFYAKVDSETYSLDQKLVDEILSFDDEVEKLSQLTGEINDYCTYYAYFKLGHYLICKRDKSYGKWKGFEELVKRIKRE